MPPARRIPPPAALRLPAMITGIGRRSKAARNPAAADQVRAWAAAALSAAPGPSRASGFSDQVLVEAIEADCIDPTCGAETVELPPRRRGRTLAPKNRAFACECSLTGWPVWAR